MFELPLDHPDLDKRKEELIAGRDDLAFLLEMTSAQPLLSKDLYYELFAGFEMLETIEDVLLWR